MKLEIFFRKLFTTSPKDSLTEEQKDIIRYTWNQLLEKTAEKNINFGSLVFNRLFIKKPTIKELFYSRSSELEEHTQIVIYAITKATLLLDDNDGLIEHMNLICDIHQEIDIDEHAIKDFKKIFISSLLEIIDLNYSINSISCSWQCFFELIIYELKRQKKL